MQELEAQQAELQTTENRYSEVKMWLDSFAEHIQSGDIMNADDSMIMKQLVEQIIVGDDGIEVHFKCGIVASLEYMYHKCPRQPEWLSGSFFAIANKRHQFRLMSLIASEILRIAQVFAIIYRKKL